MTFEINLILSFVYLRGICGVSNSEKLGFFLIPVDLFIFFPEDFASATSPSLSAMSKAFFASLMAFPLLVVGGILPNWPAILNGILKRIALCNAFNSFVF